MSDVGVLWSALSGVVVAFVGVLVFFAKYFIRKIDELGNNKAESELGKFLAKDQAREDGWTTWREDRVERTLDNHEERLRGHTAAISRMEGRMNGGSK